MKREYEHVTVKQLSDMKHAIGFAGSRVTGTKHHKYKAYRNYFTTSGKHEGWDELCRFGFAEGDPFHGGGEGSMIYRLTTEGMKFLSRLFEVEISEGT